MKKSVLMVIILISFVISIVYIVKTSSVTVLGQEDTTIVGDTFIGNKIKIGDNDAKSYSSNVFSYSKVSEQIEKNAIRLKKEFGRDWKNGGSLQKLNPDGKPEGQVWYVTGSGEFYVTGNVNGKGTIILENRNLNITGDITYADSDSSIGFILLGDNKNITIRKNVNNLFGAYFCKGTITFEK